MTNFLRRPSAAPSFIHEGNVLAPIPAVGALHGRQVWKDALTNRTTQTPNANDPSEDVLRGRHVS